MAEPSLQRLKPQSGSPHAKAANYQSWEDLYRQRWTWQDVAWVSHCINCYPGNCLYRAYVRDGIVLREEQAGVYNTIEQGVPDMNPMGCQKGAAWSQHLHSQERVLHPLKRAGERGEGRWTRVSWDDALTTIADAVIDAIQESGPESIMQISTPNEGGLMAGMLFGKIRRQRRHQRLQPRPLHDLRESEPR
jgi:nitrate reductase alpha subunit